jgi:hypothetical protein
MTTASPRIAAADPDRAPAGQASPRAAPDTVPAPPGQTLKTPAVHFGTSHPLLKVAARLCRTHPPSTRRTPCGPCWERAVRNDERIVTECGLPRELVADPNHVDAIAVALRCRGERVTLTAAEFAAAVTRLRAQGMSDTRIAARLHRSHDAVLAVPAAETISSGCAA